MMQADSCPCRILEMPIEAALWEPVSGEGIRCTSTVECEESEAASCRATELDLSGEPSRMLIRTTFGPQCDVTAAIREEGWPESVFDRFIFTLTEEEHRACGADEVTLATELFENPESGNNLSAVR